MRRSGRLVLALVVLTAAARAEADGLAISGSDVLCRPGEEARLAVKVERSGWRRRDVEGALVSFRLMEGEQGGRLLGTTVTDEDGWAEVSVRFERPGLYRVTVEALGVKEAEGKRAAEEFLVACRGTQRVGVVLDIDDTLTASDRLPPDGAARVRDPETAAVVRALARRYDLLYVSGRLRWSSSVTRRWLRREGFPLAPLFLRDLKRSGTLRSGTYKERLLRGLRRRFPNILVGVGDEDSDVQAYSDCGMLPILIEEREEEPWNVERWRQIRELLLGEEVTFTDRLTARVRRGESRVTIRCRRRGDRWELSVGGREPLRGTWPEVRSALLAYLRQGGPEG